MDSSFPPSDHRYQAIWQTLSQVPPGTVVTYGQLARLAGLPGLARFAGRVLQQLPEGSSLPWHRVINAQGRISLPPGSAAAREQAERLRCEGVEVRAGRIPLKRYQWKD